MMPRGRPSGRLLRHARRSGAPAARSAAAAHRGGSAARFRPLATRPGHQARQGAGQLRPDRVGPCRHQIGASPTPYVRTDQDLTIVAATNDVTDRTELHEMAMVDGAMVMRPIAGGI